MEPESSPLNNPHMMSDIDSYYTQRHTPPFIHRPVHMYVQKHTETDADNITLFGINTIPKHSSNGRLLVSYLLKQTH